MGAAPSPLVAKWKGNLTLSSVSLHTLVLQTPQRVARLLMKLPAHPHVNWHITCQFRDTRSRQGTAPTTMWSECLH